MNELKQPNTNLVDLAENVRDHVASLAHAANLEQVPAVNNQLLGARTIFLAGRELPHSPTAVVKSDDFESEEQRSTVKPPVQLQQPTPVQIPAVDPATMALTDKPEDLKPNAVMVPATTSPSAPAAVSSLVDTEQAHVKLVRDRPRRKPAIVFLQPDKRTEKIRGRQARVSEGTPARIRHLPASAVEGRVPVMAAAAKGEPECDWICLSARRPDESWGDRGRSLH